MSEGVVTHYWGEQAQSPCGRYVGSVYYGVQGHAYTTDWKHVDCATCLSSQAEKESNAPVTR